MTDTNGAAARIAFRPMVADDLPMLADWLARPHWREWWGDPDAGMAEFQGMLAGDDTTEPYILTLDDRPAGYIQMWRVADARVEPWKTDAPWVMELPDDAIGVDLSLADPENLSRGIGTAGLTAFVAELRQRGFAHIVIDPDPANLRAVRAYTKAGFVPVPDLHGRTGDCLVMRHSKDTTL